MSDEKNITLIGDTKIHGARKFDIHSDRATAVEIALELIKSSCAGKGENSLRTALDDLSQHADTIHAALLES